MPLRITCPSCGRSGRVPEQAVGRFIQCPACRHRYQLSAGDALPEGLELIDEPKAGRGLPDGLELVDEPAPAVSDTRFGPLDMKWKTAARGLSLPTKDDDPYPWSPASPARETGRAGVPKVALAAGIGAGLVAFLLVGGLVARMVGGGTAAPTSPVTTPTRVTRADVSAVRDATGGGKTLSTAEVVAESDQSIALIRGKSSSGTGFLIAPGLLATNAHVIDGELISTMEVRFPSAEGPRRGPFSAQLVYEDARRDLAFLSVPTDLPPLRIADAYAFRKGEEITVIGSPGLGDGVVLENAISRGVMSTRTTLDGQPFYQLGIAVNPGNSGGPVFDSSGRVIGVVTLKTEKQESLAFCVPVEDLRAALSKSDAQPAEARALARSRHRVIGAVKGLGTGGALYCLAIDVRRALSSGGLSGDQKGTSEKFLSSIVDIDKDYLSTLIPQVAEIRTDPLVAPPLRDKIGEIAENFSRLKTSYDNRNSLPSDDLRRMKGTHRRLIVELSQTLKLDVPEGMLVVFDDRETGPDTPSYSLGGFARRGFGPLGPRMPGRPGTPRVPRVPTPRYGAFR